MPADAAPGGTCGRVARGPALAPGAARTGIVLTAAVVKARGAWTDGLCQALPFHLLLNSATSALLQSPESSASASVHACAKRTSNASAL
jgi:hypothetical protein